MQPWHTSIALSGWTMQPLDNPLQCQKIRVDASTIGIELKNLHCSTEPGDVTGLRPAVLIMETYQQTSQAYSDCRFYLYGQRRSRRPGPAETGLRD
jgi:hypothetical protein